MTEIIKYKKEAPIMGLAGLGGGPTGLALAGGIIPGGQALFTGLGSQTNNRHHWTCPDDVTSISIVCIGAGGINGADEGHGGGGGGLRYKNNFTVTPGNTYHIYVGDHNDSSAAAGARDSWFSAATNTSNSSTGSNAACRGEGGGIDSFEGDGGGGNGDGGGDGGDGGVSTRPFHNRSCGGGGAGGYAGDGGRGGHLQNAKSAGLAAAANSGGGGGGGSNFSAGSTFHGGGGGGVGVYGLGATGSGGGSGANRGGNGSGGSNNSSGNVQDGGNYGGGGAGGTDDYGAAGPGAVRIIWPGDLRQFPSTRTTDE